MATGRTRTPRGEGERLRERLVDAALALIDEHGDASAVTIRAATRGAGVSPNAFYLHFASREELMGACLDRCFAEFRDTLREGAAAGTDPRDALRRAGRAYLAFAAAHPARYAAMFSLGEVTTEDSPQKPASGDEAYADLVRLVGACVSPTPTEAEGDVLAKGIWSGMHGYVTLAATRPVLGWPAPEAFVERIADAWLGPAPSG